LEHFDSEERIIQFEVRLDYSCIPRDVTQHSVLQATAQCGMSQ